MHEVRYQSAAEWQHFFDTCSTGVSDGIVERTVRIQEDHIQVLERDGGTSRTSSSTSCRSCISSGSIAAWILDKLAAFFERHFSLS